MLPLALGPGCKRVARSWAEGAQGAGAGAGSGPAVGMGQKAIIRSTQSANAASASRNTAEGGSLGSALSGLLDSPCLDGIHNSRVK